MKRICFFVQLLVCCLILGRQAAEATEGGSSYYFPGSSATFGVAVAPDPGLMIANQMLFYRGDASKSVLRGHVNLELDSSAFYNYVAGFYTFQEPVLGGRLQIGAAVPVGSVDVEVGLDATLGSRNISDNDTGLGDSLASAALYWNRGDFHFKLVQSAFLPTGAYAAGNLANAGRNYWGFDTSFAATWLNSGSGTEISIMPGIMLNTKNNSTDYQSGNELHVDVALNQFLAKSFAVGCQGYYYSQVSDDRGSGAILGSFKGRSSGVGPALFWMPGFGKGKLSLVGKWIHDLDDRHRMHGEYGQLVAAYKF